MTTVDQDHGSRPVLRRSLQACIILYAIAPAALAAQEKTGVTQTAAGYIVDFNNQNIRTVFSSLAEAAGVNVTFSNLPETRTTLHLAQPMPKTELLGVIRNVAEQNGLTVKTEGPLVRIEPARQSFGRRGDWAQSTAPKVEIYTYRLKHADAATIAPLLTNLFAGTTLNGGPPNDSAGFGSGNGGVTPRFVLGGGGGGGIIGGGGGGAGNGGSSPFRAVCSVNGQPVDCGGGSGGGGLQQFVQQLLNGGGSGNPGGGPGNGPGGGNGAAPTVSQVRVVAEESSNTLLIRATTEEWGWIQKILQDIDLRPLQVLIEAVIVEVTRTSDLNVGVDATVTHAYHGQRASADLPQTPNARDFLLQLADHAGTVDFTAALNALSTRGDVRIRSLPVIVGQNNQQALLNVGSSRPFVSVSQSAIGSAAGGVVQTIQYIDVGTKLQITPRINADGYVNLEVAQTANTATNEIQFDAPVLNKREATTQVFLRDGQTTVLGGLADQSRDETRSGIPVLRDIPLIGGLFGSTQRNETETELYVFLTPHIIAVDTDIDRLRDSLQRYSPELRRAPVQPIFPGPAKPWPPADSVPAPLPAPAPAPKDSTP